ncbi:MAG: restriction endonuclease subunit S, partial [Alphaproteobacteria bacterium]|nr:restriction endonuclease subunit S [Alphaproteobacteria bacterium]
MQGLFPQKGQTNPSMRLNDKNNNPFTKNWQNKKLGDVCDITTGNTPPKKNLENYENGLYNWATAIDFKKKYIEETIVKLSDIGKNKARLLPKGSVLVTCIASIGLNAILKKESAFNQQINGLEPKNSINGEFIYYSIENKNDDLKRLGGNKALGIINKSTFSNFKLKIPSMEEQNKIAGFLSSVDKKIENISNQLNQSKQFKKSLMQKMFI